MCDCREEGDGKWVKVELPEDVVDEIGPFTGLVYPIEGVACSLVLETTPAPMTLDSRLRK